MDDRENPDPASTDLEKLLEQKERLERLIRDKYTRQITVMFTDMKGSTSMAESQGDINARLLIKNHNDILFPLIKTNRGVLVKTMGDGTMSYFEDAADAIRTAVRIQKDIHEYNRSSKGRLAIGIRIGINSGKGIVEDKDIFGDVVNVASRFESLAQPGEICISESTHDSLGEAQDEFFCRLIKKSSLKEKTGEFKIFKVFWKQDEIEREKKNPTALAEIDEDEGAVERVASGQGASSRRTAAGKRAGKKRVSVSREKEHISRIENELDGLIVQKGETFSISDKGYRIHGDIVVNRNATLIISNAELYFDEDAGIIAMGSVKANDSLFSAIDYANKWNNVTIFSTVATNSIIENCKFQFGSGIRWQSFKKYFNVVQSGVQERSYFGGGIFVIGGTQKTVVIRQSSFHKCTAHEGGGIFLHKSEALVDECLFDGCSSKNSGGALSMFDSTASIKTCTFIKCSSGKKGGGIHCVSSDSNVEGSTFRGCTSRHYGGGIACVASSPLIKNCRFERCSAAKSGGGVYCDRKSRPRISSPGFSDCKPENINF